MKKYLFFTLTFAMSVLTMAQNIDISIKTKNEIQKSLLNKSLLPINKTLILGPNIWHFLINNNCDKKITGINVNFHIPIENKIVILKGRAIQNRKEYNIIWSCLLKNIDTKYLVRKPTKDELKKYYVITSYEIKEPVYIIESNKIIYLLDFDIEGNLFFIEKL